MKSITLNAYAKINLSLEVLRRREDGYHDILSRMQDISLHDIVTVEAVFTRDEQPAENAEECCFLCGIPVESCMNTDTIPGGRGNLAVRGAEALLLRLAEEIHRPEKIRIMIDKRLPVAAGIAGGSGNAAAVMLGLNALLGYPCSLRDLMDAGVGVGADVPFSLMLNACRNRGWLEGLPGLSEASVSAWMTGIGEQVAPAEPIPCSVILMNPGIPVSTREVYEAIDALGEREICRDLYFNIMEQYTLRRYPEAAMLKDAMRQHLRAEHIVMSGSGPTIVAYYPDRKTAAEDFRMAQCASWKKPGWRLWLADSGSRDSEASERKRTESGTAEDGRE
ncbi:MAG: hypothetical protein IJH77_06310 [Mogibacterium sp.]|nr:hypothetical protein [Mogibacterium sp.]